MGTYTLLVTSTESSVSLKSNLTDIDVYTVISMLELEKTNLINHVRNNLRNPESTEDSPNVTS